VREVIAHIVGCDEFARLYQQGLRPLEPAREYARWLEQDRDREHAEELQGRVDDTVRRRDRSADRFAGEDLLGDEDDEQHRQMV